MSCGYTNFSVNGSGADMVFSASEGEWACVRSLVTAGIVTEVLCPAPHGDYRVACRRPTFRNTDKSELKKNYKLSFACGGKKLGEVSSITTEAGAASVKYAREVQLDNELLSQLTACKLEIPAEGKEELTTKLVKDDDGQWSYP